MAQIKRCKEPFATEVDGVTRVIGSGALVSTDDPAYNRGTAAHFEDIEAHVTAATTRRAAATAGASRVEQATADPGDLRTLTPPATVEYDPGPDTVKGVLAYLDKADEAEARRVLAAEEQGQARAGILKNSDAILARYTS